MLLGVMGLGWMIEYGIGMRGKKCEMGALRRLMTSKGAEAKEEIMLNHSLTRLLIILLYKRVIIRSRLDCLSWLESDESRVSSLMLMMLLLLLLLLVRGSSGTVMYVRVLYVDQRTNGSLPLSALIVFTIVATSKAV